MGLSRRARLALWCIIFGNMLVAGIGQMWTPRSRTRAREASYEYYAPTRPVLVDDNATYVNSSLHVVYFIAVHPQRWRPVVSAQLDELVRWGLAQFASSISVVITSRKQPCACDLGLAKPNPPRAHAHAHAHAVFIEAARDCAQLVRHLIPTANVSMYPTNEYEYRGILRAWTVAQQTFPADRHSVVVLYMHTKGMFFTHSEADEGRARTGLNAQLGVVVVKPWRSVLRAFEHFPALEKAGYAAAVEGHMVRAILKSLGTN